MKVAVIDYKSGNLHSAVKAFEWALREADLIGDVWVTSRSEDIEKATHIVLPGVGAFADCRASLKSIDGIAEALEKAVNKSAKPFLGICVGMQMMATLGRENGEHSGFGWIPGEVVPIASTDSSLKIPHMGWNELIFKADTHPVLNFVSPGEHVYFVHSYRFIATHSTQVLATVDYGGPIAAIVGRDNIVGTQFHPEKSQTTGLKLIINFLRWKP